MSESEKTQMVRINDAYPIPVVLDDYRTTQGASSVEGEDPSVDLHLNSSEVDESTPIDHVAQLEDEEAHERELQELARSGVKDAAISGLRGPYIAKPGATMKMALRQGANVEEVTRTDPLTGEPRVYKVRNLDEPSNKTPREQRSEFHIGKRTKEHNELQDATEAADRISARL